MGLIKPYRKAITGTNWEYLSFKIIIAFLKNFYYNIYIK
jgi:hypothetical protein